MTRFASILIVEDEPNVRMLFRTALESLPYALSTAEDGPTALQCVQWAEPDLILLDLRMPGMGGLEVLRALRETGVKVPVIIITAYGSVPDAVEAMNLGAVDFLSKPLTPEALRTAVAEVLTRHEPRPTEAKSAEAAKTTNDPALWALQEAKRELNECEFDRADTLLTTALKLNPRLAEAHYLRGVLHELRNERHSANSEYRAALRVDPKFEPARLHLMKYFDDRLM
jgi:DNA-binding response OmpR family regulator